MKSTLHRNFALLMVSNVLSPLISMALVVAISRLRGAEFLGKYSVLMTVFVLGQSCAGLGLPIVITREVAKRRETAGRYFVSASALTVGLLVPVILIAFLILDRTLAEAEMSLAVGLILISLVPSTITLYAEAVLLGTERTGDIVALTLLESLVRTAVSTAIVISGYGVVALSLAVLLIRVLAGVAFVVALRRRGVAVSAGFDGRLCRELASQTPVVGAIPIVNAIYARADVFLLTWLTTWSEVGIYSAAVRLVDVARTIAPAYSKAVYPILSRLRGNSAEAFVDLARQSLRDVLLLVVPLAVLLAGLAAPITTLLYGPDLAPAATSLRVLAWTLIPVGLATTLAQLLFAANRQAVDLRVNVIATVVSVAANFALIPRWGAVGAAAAVLFATGVYASLQYFYVRQQVTDPSVLSYLGKLLLVSAPTTFVAGLLGASSLLLGGMLSLALLGAGLASLGVLSRQEVRRLRLSFASARTRAGTGDIT